MKVVIVGCGIGGLATGLALHQAGVEVELYEQSREVRELGVGINLLPHAVKALAELGLLAELDRTGIHTSRLVLMNRHGQTVWEEPRGVAAGYDLPQISINRGALQGLLYRALTDRIGVECVHLGQRFMSMREDEAGVHAMFERREDGAHVEVQADAVIGADGIHSALRAQLYPNEGAPAWNGIMIWRGATQWPTYADGRTMVIAGGNDAKLVFYPIHAGAACPDTRLTNWGIMARLGDGSAPPPRREDWNRPALRDEVLAFVRDQFRLEFVDPVALIEATETIYEFPCCDRDPLPRWSFGRATLLGDAAHPMYPTGSNGASQAILDALSLASLIASCAPVCEALMAYDAERGEATAEIVRANRRGGPERVIDLVEARAPDGFEDLDCVATHAEREAIVRGYANLAGFAQEQVNRG